MHAIKSVGFLFNHDATHQVAHIAPIMAAFRRYYPHVQVSALASSDEQLAVLDALGGSCADPSIVRIKLPTPGQLTQLFKWLNAVAPVQRLYVLKRYQELLSQFDCLVVPEMTSAMLKTRLGMSDTPLALVPHGAGDRAIGFCQESKHYNYVLLSGTKVRDRMLAGGLIRADNHCLVGYPKFDAVELEKRASIFANEQPTVLYNPHCDPHLSSWYRMGHEVLEFFADNPHLNLIFAPHVMLFRKRLHISLERGAARWAKAPADKSRTPIPDDFCGRN
jgi:hypothetical protein